MSLNQKNSLDSNIIIIVMLIIIIIIMLIMILIIVIMKPILTALELKISQKKSKNL